MPRPMQLRIRVESGPRHTNVLRHSTSTLSVMNILCPLAAMEATMSAPIRAILVGRTQRPSRTGLRRKPYRTFPTKPHQESRLSRLTRATGGCTQTRVVNAESSPNFWRNGRKVSLVERAEPCRRSTGDNFLSPNHYRTTCSARSFTSSVQCVALCLGYAPRCWRYSSPSCHE